MFDCWSEIKKLEGRTLFVLAQRKLFDVVEVSDTFVVVRPHLHNKLRPIPRDQVEGACKELLSKGKITRIRIQQAHSEFHPAFVAALLANLPGMTYTIKPITIHHQEFQPQEKAPLAAKKQPPPPADMPPAPPIAGAFRDRASFGKRMEFVVIAELLRRGYDVYQTLVDDQGIDCVVRLEKDSAPGYLDIQIKARSKDIDPAYAAFFAAMDIPNPRPNYFFIFYSEQVDTFWFVPSLDLAKIAIQNRTGKNKGKYSINFCRRQAGRAAPDPKFARYQNAFHLLDC
jgi:hypothetical protein